MISRHQSHIATPTKYQLWRSQGLTLAKDHDDYDYDDDYDALSYVPHLVTTRIQPGGAHDDYCGPPSYMYHETA